MQSLAREKIFFGSLRPMIQQVSRSFYLSLKILPQAIRLPVTLAYLLARAADTIADVHLLPSGQRLFWLNLLKYQVQVPHLAVLDWQALESAIQVSLDHQWEQQLLLQGPYLIAVLASLPSEMQQAVQQVVVQLSRGIALDVYRFPGNSVRDLRALQNDAELEHYCYQVAGVVGEFWTWALAQRLKQLSAVQYQSLVEKGVAYGKGLQLLNIYRDISQDHQLGRCYLPRQQLEALGLQPEDLADSAKQIVLQPLLVTIQERICNDLYAGQAYVIGIPRRYVLCRLATLWPLWIGVATLKKLSSSRCLLDPTANLKISRWQVRVLLMKSLFCVCSNTLLQRVFTKQMEAITR